jgi:4-hydroxybenzoate polyprenyltransferase
MKLSRLFQPRNPLFWLMLAFSVLSSACAWALHALPLSTLGLVLIGSVGLANALISLVLTWRLIRD